MFSRADHGEAQRALLKDDRLLRGGFRDARGGDRDAACMTGRGKPPPFIRLGRAVRYRLSDHQLIRQGGYANRPGGGEHAS